MKLFFYFLVFFLFVLPPDAAKPQARPPHAQHLIFTQATAEVTGQNDSANLVIGIQTEARAMKKAAADNAVQTEAVLQAIQDLRIQKLQTKTRNYRVTPKKDFKANPPVIEGYEVVNEIEVKTEGFAPQELSDHVSKVIETSLQQGANTIGGIHFYVKNKKSLEKQALTLATQEAMEQAHILADAAGVQLGRIVSISTQPVAAPHRKEMFRAAGVAAQDAAMAPPIESGESKISARVYVVYDMK